MMAPHVNGGLALNPAVGYIVAGAISLAAFVTFNLYCVKRQTAKRKFRAA